MILCKMLIIENGRQYAGIYRLLELNVAYASIYIIGFIATKQREKQN